MISIICTITFPTLFTADINFHDNLFFLDTTIWTETYVQPFVIIGPIITVCGLAFIFFGFEICVRYKKNARRVQDPEIDTMKNIHHIKHWMDPGK